MQSDFPPLLNSDQEFGPPSFQASMRSMLESSPEVIAFSLDREYRYTFFNSHHSATMKAIWGASIQLGQSMLDFIRSPDDRTKAKQNFDRALQGERFTVIEEYGDESLDRSVWEDIYSPVRSTSGEVIGLTVFVMNVSRRYEAERELVKSREQLQSILSTLCDAVISVDERTGQVLHANPACESILGISPTELRSKQRPIETLYLAGKPSPGPEIELKTTHANGKKAWLLIRSNTVKSDDGVALRTDYIITDITSRKKAEREREELQNQLFQASKLASIGTLAAGVAHEINNPLMVIQAFGTMLKSGLTESGADERHLKFTDKLLSASERIANIVNSLRTYSRRDAHLTEPIDVHKSIQDTLVLCTEIFRSAGTAIRADLQSVSPTIIGNGGKLQQVLLNLLNNAKDALAGKADGFIEIRTTDENGKLAIRITDNGIGILPDALPHIFDAFYTTKPPGQGTGLGLSISQSIISAFGGNISATSQPGSGTTFTILFPQTE